MKKSNAADIFGKAPVFQAVFKNALPAQYYFDPVIAAPLTGPDTLQYLHRFPPLPVME